MANHRARAQFDRAKWSLSLLLPLWALQLTLVMAMTGLFSWRLGDSVKRHRQRETSEEQAGEKAGEMAGETAAVEFAWEATNIAMSLVAACCTFFEMGKLMAESLTPWTMLFTHVIKLVCALAILALDIAVYALRAEARYSLVGLGLDAVLIITAVVLSIYAIVTYRRLSAYDDYARPVNFKGYGFNDDDDFSYSGRHSFASASEKRSSLASIRSGIRPLAPEPPPPASPEQTAPGRGSYSHRRDTQFDDYVARRSSQGSTLEGVVGAAEASSSTASIKTRSRGPSYTSDRGLVAVPEEDPEPLDGSERQQLRRADRQALLGSSQRTSRVDGEAGAIGRPARSQTARRLLRG